MAAEVAQDGGEGEEDHPVRLVPELLDALSAHADYLEALTVLVHPSSNESGEAEVLLAARPLPTLARVAEVLAGSSTLRNVPDPEGGRPA